MQIKNLKFLFCILLFIGFQNNLNAQFTLKDSLVAHYKFDGNTLDASGNGFNAINNGGLFVSDRFGNPNSAMEFNGISNYVNTNSTFDFDYRTLSLWVNPFNVQGNGLNEKHVAGQDASSLTYGQLKIKFSDGNLEGRAGGEASNFVYPITPNNWYNIVYVRDGSTVRYYVGGVLVGNSISGATASTTVPNPTFFIGKGRYPNNQFFEGVIDDVRIYNRAFSQADVDSVFNEGIQSVKATCDSSSNTFFLELRHQSDLKLQGLVVDQNKDIALIGTIQNSVFGGLDVCFFKFDSLGNLLNSKLYGSSLDNEGRSVSIDEAPGAGYYVGFFSNVGSSRTSEIMKIDYLGNIIWKKSMCDLNNCFARSIKTTQDGGVILGGKSDGNCVIAKVDSQGNLNFHKTFGGSGSDQLSGVFELPDSSIVGIIHQTTQASGNQDGAIVRLDKVGNLIWQNSYGNSKNDALIDGFYSSQENVIYAMGIVDNSTKDILILKVDLSGNLLESFALDAGSFEKGSSIYEGKNKAIYISCYGDGTQSDMLLIKLDSNHTVEFGKSYGSAGTDETGNWGRCFYESKNNLYLAGYGNGNIPNEGFNGYFLKLNNCGDENCTSQSLNFTKSTEILTQSTINYTYTNSTNIQTSLVSEANLTINIDTVCFQETILPSCISVELIDSINSARQGFTNQLDNNDVFGKSTEYLGDFDNDGNDEIAVGAVLDDDGAIDAGSVYIIDLNQNNQFISSVKISATSGGFVGIGNNHRFGASVTSLGDFDGDGIGDIAVGAPRSPGNGLNRGAVYILLLNANGSVKSQTFIGDNLGGFNAPLANNDFFGFSLTNMGDIDGDGITDLAVCAYKDDDGNTNAGCVYILFLNANGTVKSHQKISASTGGFLGVLSPEDNFGLSVKNIGDLNQDGINELASSVPFDDDGANDAGSVYVLFLNQNGTVKKQFKIANSTPGLNNQFLANRRLGRGIENLGDLNQNGNIEIAIGSHFDNNTGLMYVFDIDSSGNVTKEFEIGKSTPSLSNSIVAGDLFSLDISRIKDVNNKINLAVSCNSSGTLAVDAGQVFIISIEDSCNKKCDLSASFAIPSFSYCYNDTVNFDASISNDTAYQWYINNQLFSFNKDSFLILQTDTTLQVKLKYYNNACFDSISTLIQVFGPPNINKSPNLIACQNDTVSIGVANPASYSYQWQNNIGDTIPIIKVLANDSIDTYIIKATDNISTGCSIYDTILVQGIKPPQVKLNEDTSVCFASNFQLAPLLADSGNYQWRNLAGLIIDSSLTINQQVDSASTLIFKVEEPVLGCANEDSIFIFVLPKINLVAPSDSSLCQGDTIFLSIPFIKHSIINWAPTIGVANPTSFSSGIYGIDSTINYKLLVTDTLKGCFAIDSVTIKTNDNEFIRLNIDSSLCQKDTLLLNLSLSGNYSYNWGPGKLFTDSTILNSALYLDSGLTKLFLITTDTLTGCSDIDSAEFNVAQFKGAKIPSKIDFCESDSATFNIPNSAADLFYWEPSFGLTNEYNQNQIFNLSDTIIKYKIYQIDTQSNCFGLDSFQVNFFKPYVGFDNNNYEVCDSLVYITGPNARQFNWKPRALFSDSTIQNPTLNFKSGINYSVETIDSFGCSKSFDLIVKANILIDPIIETQQNPKCEFTMVDAELINQGDYSSFIWNVKNDSISSRKLFFEYPNNEKPIIKLITYSGNNCVDTTNLSLQENIIDSILSSVEFPNIFTPNGDGKNDWLEFDLPLGFQECANIQVFNRWGQLVYSSENSLVTSWNGRTNVGREAPDGIYFYVVSILENEFKGSATLIR